jgi:hypothetical protein
MILPDDLPPLNVQIIRLAQLDIPILETPLDSNRSPEIDAMCRAFGVPLGSYWCALWKAKIWRAAGASIPPIDAKKGWHPAIAETWHQWAIATGAFSKTPVLGGGVLYDFTGTGKADHVGAAVASIKPILMDFEGNTSLAGSADRNGELATIKPVVTKSVLGYVVPRAA